VHPPTTVKSARSLAETPYEEADRPHAAAPALPHRAGRAGGSPTLDRVPMLFNNDIAMLYVEPDKQDEHFYRNAQADEVVYVAEGEGTLETVR
jgi:homogentisate 1,2-dioxygenase